MRSRVLIGGCCVVLGLGLGVVALRRAEPFRVVEGTRPPEAQAGGSASRSASASSQGFLGVVLPEATVDLASRLEGRLASVRRQVGEAVKQGEVLAVLDGEMLRRDIRVAEAQLQSSQAETQIATLSMAEALERRERFEGTSLLGLGAVSQEEATTARYAHMMAVAKEQSASARARESQARLERLQQELKEAELRAPFSGVVAHRFADPGALVKPGQVLFHLLRTGVQRVRFAVPEAQARLLTVGREVSITVPSQGLTLAGRVSHVSPEVDAAARVVLCLAELDRPSDSLLLSSGVVVRVFPVPEMTARRSLP